jgi:hypothetical protein
MAAFGKDSLEPGDIGVGATDELSLRVSVATLARVVFEHPEQGTRMLALERLATFRASAGQGEVWVRAQPFGGAVRVRSLRALQRLIGGFHFDSERSREEADFRLQIRPSAWETVKRFCLRHLQQREDGALETSPDRELAEEFADAMEVEVTPAQYRVRPVGAVIENEPTMTDNVHAGGAPTVRIYAVHKVCILDPSLSEAILIHSERYTDQELSALARGEAGRDGKGRANGVLALPLELVTKAYRAMSPSQRDAPVRIAGHWLDRNVPAVLEQVCAPKLQRLDNGAVGHAI